MKKQTTAVSLQQISLVLLVLFFLSGKKIFVLLAIVLLVALLENWKWIAPIAMVWEQFMAILGRITSTIILSVFFIVLFTPFALLYRLFHRTEERSFKGRAGGSTFAKVTELATPESFERLW